MFILGVLILLAAGGLLVDVVMQNTTTISVHALGRTFTMSPGWLAVFGAIAGVIAVVGLALAMDGARRARARRRLVAHTRETAGALQAERDHLAAELEAERSARLQAEEGAAGPESVAIKAAKIEEPLILTDAAKSPG